MTYHADPEAIPLQSADAIAYDVAAMAYAAGAAPPVAREAYGPDRAQQLEIYAPKAASGLPVLLFFHGGAWVSGHLGWLRCMADAVTALPAVFVAASYRLAPRCRWPAQYDDVVSAWRHVRERAPIYGGDPHRIAVGGHSAGGHLAAMLALQKPTPSMVGCLPVSASFDLRYGDVPIDSDAGRVYRYLFADRAQDSDASPITRVHGAAPPFHIMWGDNDFARVSRSARRMVESLATAGVSVTSDVQANASHFDTHLALRDGAHPWHLRLAQMLKSSAMIEKGAGL